MMTNRQVATTPTKPIATYSNQTLPIRCQADGRPILVLDLDGTLVYAPPREWHFCGRRLSGRNNVGAPNDADMFGGNTGFVVPGNAGDKVVPGNAGDKVVLERPFARHFLANLARAYTLVVYTEAEPEFATKVVKHLDPARTLISACFSRADLVDLKHGMAKDLSRVCTDLTRVVLVDDCPANFLPQPENGMRIRAWHGDAGDKELYRLGHFLLSHSGEPDLRLFADFWHWVRDSESGSGSDSE